MRSRMVESLSSRVVCAGECGASADDATRLKLWICWKGVWLCPDCVVISLSPVAEARAAEKRAAFLAVLDDALGEPHVEPAIAEEKSLGRLSRAQKERAGRAAIFAGPSDGPCHNCGSAETGEGDLDVRYSLGAGVTHGCHVCGHVWANEAAASPLPIPPDVATPEGDAWLQTRLLKMVEECPGIDEQELLREAKRAATSCYVGADIEEVAKRLLREMAEQEVLGRREQRGLLDAPARYWRRRPLLFCPNPSCCGWKYTSGKPGNCHVCGTPRVPLDEIKTPTKRSRIATEEEHRTLLLDTVRDRAPISSGDLFKIVEAVLGQRLDRDARAAAFESLMDGNCIKQNSSEDWELADPPLVLPASIEEHRRAITASIIDKTNGVRRGRTGWPTPSAMLAAVGGLLGERLDGPAYAAALTDLKLTNKQWEMLVAAVDGPVALLNMHEDNAAAGMIQSGYGARRIVGGRQDAQQPTFQINEAGRARIAMGRGL